MILSCFCNLEFKKYHSVPHGFPQNKQSSCMPKSRGSPATPASSPAPPPPDALLLIPQNTRLLTLVQSYSLIILASPEARRHMHTKIPNTEGLAKPPECRSAWDFVAACVTWVVHSLRSRGCEEPFLHSGVIQSQVLSTQMHHAMDAEFMTVPFQSSCLLS